MNKVPYVVALALSKQLKQTVAVGHSGPFMYLMGETTTLVMRRETSYSPKEILGKGLEHLRMPDKPKKDDSRVSYRR